VRFHIRVWFEWIGFFFVPPQKRDNRRSTRTGNIAGKVVFKIILRRRMSCAVSCFITFVSFSWAICVFPGCRLLWVAIAPHFYGGKPGFHSSGLREAEARGLRLSLPLASLHPGAEIGRIASKYVRVSLPAPPPASLPPSPALTADKAEVVLVQAQPQRLDLFTPPPRPPTPHQPLPAEPPSDRTEGDKEPKHLPILKAANMNHHHTQQQQQKAGEQQLSEPEDMEMEGTSRP